MLKKTETIELRLPYQTKQAFMARCSAAGVSASEVLRGFIAGYLESCARPRSNRAALAARVGLALGALAAVGVIAEPALARAAVSASFSRMDANHDGGITWLEFSRAARPQVVLEMGSSRADAGLSADLRTRVLNDSFARIDKDRDGSISRKEYEAFTEGR